jgi:predicted ATPase
MITLVDVLYEYSVVLVSLADAIPLKLFELSQQERLEYVQDEVFAFDRCVSRLMEMQSEVYLKGKSVE